MGAKKEQYLTKDFNNDRENLTENDLNEIFELLSSRLRSKNAILLRKRLFNHLNLTPYLGILSRIQFDSRYGWSYCAGQSYPDEIRTCRNIILNLK